MTVVDLVQKLRYQDATKPTKEEIERRKRFLARYPNLEAKMLTYQDNPNCKCRGEIIAAILETPSQVDEIASYLLGQTTRIITPKQIAGKAMTIPNTDKAWEDLINRCRREMLVYNGITTFLNPDGMVRVLFY